MKRIRALEEEMREWLEAGYVVKVAEDDGCGPTFEFTDKGREMWDAGFLLENSQEPHQRECEVHQQKIYFR